MSTELESLDSFSDSSCLLDWALQTGVWDGRTVSWMEASEFREEVLYRIVQLLQERGGDPMQMAAQLAWIGTSKSSQSLLAREIQALDFSKNNLILQAGLRKSASKFWKKHKKEILIGAVILAVVTVVVIVSVSTAGTGTGAVAAVGGAALGAVTDEEKKAPEKPKLPTPSPISTDTKAPFEKQDPFLFPSITLDPGLSSNKLLFGETGVLLDGQYSSYHDILANQWKPSALPYEFSLSQFDVLRSEPAIAPALEAPPPFSKEPAVDIEMPPLPKHSSWMDYFVSTLGKDIDNPDLFDPSVPLPAPPEISSRFTIFGKGIPIANVGGINGIATSMKDAKAHAEYLAKLADGHTIDWVYNRSHGPIVDLAEVFTMNYLGVSPYTSTLLQKTWSEFHRQNLGNPHAKYLQFCHSQGAIHVRNALEKLPKEIRDRVIVVAIAPAAIIPKELCYDSYNYASKNDPVNYGELFWAASLDSTECGMSKKVEMVLELRNQLIILDPHPDATGIDHDFQSPTFVKTITGHLDDHIYRKGQYK